MGPPDPGRDVFVGHEFSARILDLGPSTEGPAPGTLVTSMPVMIDGSRIRDLAYNNDMPGGFSERMLLSAPLLVPVPNGLDARRAALTEPMAVGLHAVNRSGMAPAGRGAGGRSGAVVVGCGPVGLAVIAALKLRGVEAVVASDYSPARRALALSMGAHAVVDPAQADPFDTWAEVGKGRELVVFEAVGVPGVINSVMRRAPRGARMVVVGVCMQDDTVVPLYGIAKEIDIRFALAYDPMEFSESLSAIAEGRIDVTPMITGEVDLAGLAEAFEELGDPERHCKILCRPGGRLGP
jgi:threonine dehydrogenase-like Zn-dependent dehydrogenase